jgi:hypothetical protein
VGSGKVINTDKANIMAVIGINPSWIT